MVHPFSAIVTAAQLQKRMSCRRIINDRDRRPPEIQSQLETNKAALESVNASTDAAIIKNKEYWKSVLDEATAARDKLGTDQVGSDEWERLTTLINSASKQLDVYSTKLKNVKDDSKTLAPRDVGNVEGVGAGFTLSRR